MFARALIVLLLVLNIGVASWWLLRAPPPMAKVEQPRGVPRLQLVSELPPSARMPVAPKPAPVAVAADAQCFSFGPFVPAALATARAQLQPRVQRLLVRTQAASPPRGWRVQIPPQPSPEAAQALAQRITAAGFADLLVLHEGSEANAIALGRYGSRETATRRADALIAAGFPARAEPLGDATPQTWLDVAAAVPPFDAAATQAATGASQRRPIDCAGLR